ncbi:MAG: insulinase family protein [Acidobacteria bacterium]|nr:insulinase family protein [Acidobacteriota bacterium]
MRRLILPFLAAAMALQAQPAATKPRPQAPRRAAALPSVPELKFPPLRQVQMPHIETFTLANGMKVYLLENHELPLVGGFALVRAGNLFDPREKVGLATITGMTMRTGGTKKNTGDQLDEELENVAASVETFIGETSGRVSFNTLRENTDRVLAVFKDVLTSPEFRQDKIDLAKNQLRAGIMRRNDEPHGIASREFTEIIYGRDNPYGWRMELEHVDRIQRADLVAFHQRYFFPANVMLAVQGDFKTAEMRPKLEQLFVDWNLKQAPVPAFPKVEAKVSPGIYLAVKKDVTQTFFSLGHLGGLLSDPNYPALSVMVDILGGGFSSRLFREVRTRLGYAYHVGARWGANYQHAGIFGISGSTKSVSAVDTIRAIRAEVDKIRTAAVSDQELETAKQSVLNSFVFNFDHPSKILSRVVTYDYYGYPPDFIFQYQKGVAAVTKADVLRVAKQYVHPENFTMVSVGNPDEFKVPLTTLGAVKNIDLTIPQPKQAVSKGDPANLAKGAQILKRAQQAVGGADKLAAVKDVTQVAEVTLATGAGGGLKAKQTNQWVAPGTLRQVQELPFGKQTVFFDGKTGWIVGPQGQAPMPGAVVKQVQDQLFRNWVTLLLSDRNSDRTVNAVGDNAIEISDREGNLTRLELEPATGLPVAQRYQMGPAAVKETYGEWKEVAGIRAPHKITLEQGGRKAMEAAISEVKFNSGLTAEELSRKP